MRARGGRRICRRKRVKKKEKTRKAKKRLGRTVIKRRRK